jgi:hypothetical protein
MTKRYIVYPSPLEGRGEGEGDDEGVSGDTFPEYLVGKQDRISWNDIFLYFLLTFKLYTKY